MTQWISVIFQGNVPQNLPKYVWANYDNSEVSHTRRVTFNSSSSPKSLFNHQTGKKLTLRMKKKKKKKKRL